ncbi:hypothetical protein A2483_03080 [Candidatus Peregrinibacteria bacterium RIFOXYC2_FULL_33_13]|nr:MAG: ATP synthase subunit b [Candidatus Peregrinibacteria bacterium GW2011_GWA2_33_10]KKP39946.1 MAG: ATP synthase F0 subunit B, F-type H+-transporting ATPase subunit b [Candidatus Peregrinibacteria bacterium GW2011_GWC2_33_13]OGJ50692.1 MAG: hypothetical protein A2229_04120 [Candidatus Peregrinibacteria bacterium RIFOXYA2_FULL_33_7]OGJ52017.1 MAG: hypothetical protein A2483_03080 [Candidatus Peregrinibacteria bacterium RIFOXYC2_FULL_33_13]
MEGLNNLGIDFQSILLYLVNVGVLILVLTKLLYKPVLKAMDQRREHIKNSINEADKLKHEFQKKYDEMNQEKEDLKAKMQAEMQKLQKYAEEKKSEMLKEIELERVRMIEETQAELQKKKDELIPDIEKKLIIIIKKVILDFVQHKVPENIIEESITHSLDKTKKELY